MWLTYDFVRYNITPPPYVRSENKIPKPLDIQGKHAFAFDFVKEQWIYKSNSLDTKDYIPYKIPTDDFNKFMQGHMENNFENYFEEYEEDY